MFSGSMVALATPFDADGAVDERALAALVEWHVAAGTAAVVPAGTTGESATLSRAEHDRVVTVTVAAASGRIAVIAGAGSSSTSEAVSLARHARAAGAAACLVVVPPYNRPTQEGLFLHFAAVAREGGLPVIVYNIPSRSAVDMSVATLARLAALPGIVGVKDSTQDLARPLRTRRLCGERFVQLSGEDATALPFLAAGGVGCISVTANVAPELCAAMHAAWQAGRLAEAMAIQDRLAPLHDALFCETSPAPVKHALSLLGRARADARLPIAPLSPAGAATVAAAMREAGLIPA